MQPENAKIEAGALDSQSQRIEQALRYVALGVSGARGAEVFREIVRYLTVALGVDCAFIGKLIKAPCERVRTLAVYDRGTFLANVEYNLKGTPCENVVGKCFEFIPVGAPVRYPGDSMLRELHFESYAAYPLFDCHGNALGLIAVTDRKPLCDRVAAESMLKIFSVRAAAELERLKAEEAQRKSENRLRATFEAALDCIVSMDSEGTIIEFNPAAERCFGYRRKDVIGKPLADLLIPERDRDAHRKGLERYRTKRNGPFLGRRMEVDALRADGSEFPVELAIAVAQGAEGDIFIGYLRDITERKEAEEKRSLLETQLRQARKMEAIGHLSGGIAHDFNNILTGIMGYVVLAQERADRLGDPKLSKYLERAGQAGQRARDLIRQLLTFSRGQRGEPRPLALKPLVKEAVKLLGPTLPASVELETDLDARLPAVMLDPVQVEQVLMNLCINARDAMEGKGRIELGLHGVRHLRALCASCHQPVEGEFVELSVRDTGPGIAPEHLDRIFEPFFTTKGAGKGSGMGLATVHGIVHEYGAHILVDTALGQGATFRVLFPPLEASHPDRVCSSGRDRSMAGDRKSLNGHVLLVDDDDVAGGFMRDLFDSWGLEVTLARDGIEGRDRFAEDPQRYDLALLDQAMPRMTGLELTRHLFALRPELPVILYTGYSDDLSDEQVKAAGIHALIRKPVDVDELLKLMSELLIASET